MIELYDWQREAIDALTGEPGRVLVVAPTGGGKSMCYQQPAVDLPGVALVISPLVSLMNDQVTALAERDVPAAYLASTSDDAENRRCIDLALAGKLKLLYVAPERLASQRFVDDVLARLDLSLLAVDEAHCISHWGHDFRPDYLRIGELVQRLQPKRIVACTATATPAVRAEIVERLHMPEARQILRGFARPNLQLSVEEVSGPKKKEERIVAEVKRVLKSPRGGLGTAIVYTPTRNNAENAAEALRANGWRADHYHAGMDGDARTRVQQRFQSGDLDVVAATNAFGMGIDRPDIRLVLHHGTPESIESYYQEVGRAGRDGAPAEGILFISDPDIAWRFKLIASEQMSAELALRRREMLRSMVDYAETSACRHDTILRYFEDEAEALGGCGHCDNCRRAADEPDEAASTESVRAALNAVRSLPFAVGAGTVAAYLAGHANAQVTQRGWEKQPMFGALRDRSPDWTKRLLRRFVAAGLLAVDPEHATLKLSRRGADVASGAKPNPVRLPAGASGGPAFGRTGKRIAPEEAAMQGCSLDLLARLKTWRGERADKLDAPAYIIFGDAALRGIADAHPASEEDMLAVSGVGPTKFSQYGADVLAIVRQHAAEYHTATEKAS